jgi:NTP pyrophosphatase (non-canonical NTP hydrolase)
MERPTVKREYMPDLMKFLEQVEKLRGAADKIGVWVTPPPEDCLAFAVTEAGEAVDALLRQNPRYARSHKKKVSVEHELGDMAVMLASYLIQGELPSNEEDWPNYVNKPVVHRIINNAVSAWYSFCDDLGHTERSTLRSLTGIIRMLGSDALTSHINYLWDKWVSGERKDDKIVPLTYCPACDWYFPPGTGECTGCHNPTKPAYMKQVPMDPGECV